jgi:hypothetical protein
MVAAIHAPLNKALIPPKSERIFIRFKRSHPKAAGSALKFDEGAVINTTKAVIFRMGNVNLAEAHEQHFP